MRRDVLEYLVHEEPERIEEQLQDTKHEPAAALGVAKVLLANESNVELLSVKQRFYWDEYLRPLLEEVPCEGVMNDPEQVTCSGNGLVDQDSLLMSYQEAEFLCQHCRYDRGKMP